MEFDYEIKSYIPHEDRMFVSYIPVDTSLDPYGWWVHITSDMTEEQIKEAIKKGAPFHVWNAPVNEAANNLTGFKTTTPVSHTAPTRVPPSVNLAEMNRHQRDTLLTLCDWTVLADCKLTESQKAEWLSYRQALRDITLQPNFPNLTETDWPVPPTP